MDVVVVSVVTAIQGHRPSVQHSSIYYCVCYSSNINTS